VQKLHADAEVMKKVGEQKEYDEKKVEEQKRYDGAAALSNATQKTTSYTVQNFPADTEVKKNIEVQNCYDDVAAQSIAPQKSSTITVHKKFNADTEPKKTLEEQEMNESTAALSLEPQKASSVLVQNKPRGETRDKIKKKTEVRNTALPIATQRVCSYPVQKKTDEKKKLKKQNTSDFSAALLSAPKNTSIHLSPSLPHAETGEKKKNKTFFLVNISRWLKSKTKVLKENVSGHIAQDGKSCKKGAEIRDELANSVQGGAAGLVPKFKFAPRIFVSKPREPETENVQLEPRPDPLYLSFMKGNASDQNLPKDQICKKRGAQEPAECPRKNESVPVKPVQTDTITHSVQMKPTNVLKFRLVHHDVVNRTETILEQVLEVDAESPVAVPRKNGQTDTITNSVQSEPANLLRFRLVDYDVFNRTETVLKQIQDVVVDLPVAVPVKNGQTDTITNSVQSRVNHVNTCCAWWHLVILVFFIYLLFSKCSLRNIFIIVSPLMVFILMIVLQLMFAEVSYLI
jgi:hypothetical protein